jgi:hypothetical protein
MKPIRIMLALALVLAGVLLAVPPAQAGGWAVTVIDPLPERLEPDRPYTIGFWVLQHGSHPYDGDLGSTGLRFVDGGGRAVTFEGVAMREPAHFAAAVSLPRRGVWKVYGLQGLFAEYEVGTLALPGGLTLLRPPTPMATHNDTHWGLIQPPDVAAMAVDTTLPENPAGIGYAPVPAPAEPAVAEPAGQRPRQAPQADGVLPSAGVLWIGLGLAAVGGAIVLGRRRVLRAALGRRAPKDVGG